MRKADKSKKTKKGQAPEKGFAAPDYTDKKKERTPEIKLMHLPAGSVHNTPDHIVLHSMSEYIDGLHAVDFLKSVGFSVHAMVTPDGKIIRCREGKEGAYHAKYYNTSTLGVEFLVSGENTYVSFLSAIQKEYVSKAQYAAGVHLLKYWLDRYTIHDVSTHRYLSPGRKFDPGLGFPYKRFEKDIGVKINDIG